MRCKNLPKASWAMPAAQAAESARGLTAGSVGEISDRESVESLPPSETEIDLLCAAISTA
jgi:hypothetical protein